MLDFGSQYVPSIGEAWLHNGGLTFNHEENLRPCPGRGQPGCYFTGKVWVDHQTEPFTCLEPGQPPDARDLDTALGKATAFATLPAADYGEMTRRISYLDRVPYMLENLHGQFMGRGPTEPVYVQQPFDWVRRFVFVKPPDFRYPDYLVMRDDLSGNRDLSPALNFWCLADALEVQDQRATYTGQHGVDLDLYVAEPTVFTHRTHRVGHTNGREFAAHYQATFGKPFEEYQILFQVPQAPGGGGFFVALVPRKHDRPAPRFATVLEGRGMQVAFPERVDTVILMNRPEQVTWEGLSLRGTVFVVTRAGGEMSVTMLAPGEVRRGDRVLLRGNRPTTVEVR
jgi:hypothetical protein